MAKSPPVLEAEDVEPPDPRRAVTLDTVLGNEPVRAFLRRAVRGGSLPQSLLLAGPAGIGKTTLAYALMREIVAEGGDPATHPRALKIARNVHPDVFEITGKASASSLIRVDDIRAMEDRVWTSPLESTHKMVLIEPADRMNTSSANCLLKLLEEPPPHLLIILVTPEPGRLLDTIRSRCAVMHLEPVALDALQAWVQARTGLTAEKARLVSLLAEGRPGLALRLSEAGILRQRAELLAALQTLHQEGFAALFAVADRFLGIEATLEETLLMAMTLMRDALMTTAHAEGILNHDLREPIGALAASSSVEGLLVAAGRFEDAAHESPYFYTPQARAHFVEVLLADVGRMLRA